MKRLVLPAAFVLVLSGCATTNAGYTDGSYSGPYNGGYYAAAHDGSGDYYYDRPEVVYDEPYNASFAFGYPWGWGYNPWFYGAWWGYHPWCDWHCHHHHHDWDHGPWTHTAIAHNVPMRAPVHAPPPGHAPAAWRGGTSRSSGGFRGSIHTPAH